MKKKRAPVIEIADMRSGRDDRTFAAVMTVLFASVMLVAALHHEMWRDEILIWMYGRGIHSIRDLVSVIAYEPHPALWYLCVLAVVKIFASPFSIQVLNLVIASCATYVLLRYAPLPRLQKGLFVFGFFPFFEYGVISRAYALGLLFAYVFCALFPYRRKRLIGLSGMLFLLANTSAFGMFLAFSLALTLFVSWHYDKRVGKPWGIGSWRAIVAAFIVALGVVLSVLQTASPSDVGLINHSGHNIFQFNSVEAFSKLAQVYLYNFGQIPALNGFVSALALFALAVLSLRRKPVALFAYLTATALMLGAIYFRQIAYLWHLGHLLIAYMVSLWLAACYDPPEQRRETKCRVSSNPAGTQFRSFADKFSNWFVYAILVFQLLPCAYAVYDDYVQPYSCGKEVASYIRQHDMERLAIAGDVYYTVQTISGYLGKPVYYLKLGENGTLSWFGDDLPPDIRDITMDELAYRVQAIADKEQYGVLLILSYPLNAAIANYLDASFVTSFKNSIGGFIQSEKLCYENYWLYVVRKQ